MAKQTFTTGQVLTAAQMTSLQQTAMGGGSATAKTASYTLVAADAGTTVAMNAAGATTITVNTGLFAAGDTVFIQNLGAGACTVTAGTATVATAGSLILPQNDAGILYFTSASAAIFYDYIQAGAVSPLTTKGDLYTFSTSDARLGVGANGTTLVADSGEATGLRWAAPASGAMVKIASAPFSASAGVAINECFSSTYTDYILVVSGLGDSTNGDVFLQFQTGTSTVYSGNQYYGALLKLPETATPAYVGNAPAVKFTIGAIASNARHTFTATINNVGNASANASYSAYGNMSTTGASISGGIVNNSAIYTGLYLTGAGNLTGNYAIYGLVK